MKKNILTLVVLTNLLFSSACLNFSKPTTVVREPRGPGRKYA